MKAEGALARGARLADGRYEVHRPLGEGGFGTVYEVTDHETGKRLALKLLRQLNADSLFRFKREFRILADLVHPNLVVLHDAFAEGDLWFFTMDMAGGRDFVNAVRPAGDLDGRYGHQIKRDA